MVVYYISVAAMVVACLQVMSINVLSWLLALGGIVGLLTSYLLTSYVG